MVQMFLAGAVGDGTGIDLGDCQLRKKRQCLTTAFLSMKMTMVHAITKYSRVAFRQILQAREGEVGVYPRAASDCDCVCDIAVVFQ